MSLVVGDTLHGLIGALGCSGGSEGAGVSWHLVVSLVAYRVRGEVTRASVRCTSPMSQSDALHWMRRAGPYSMIEATVVGFGERDAVLIADLTQPTGRDADLDAIAEELRKPVVLRTRLFGDLVLDRSLDWFNGNATWCGRRTRFSIAVSDHDDPNVAVAAAESLFQAQEQWQQQALDAAVDELLAVKNESWLEDGARPLTREEFVSHMAVEGVHVDASGEFTLDYGVGDLFWGHGILVDGSLADGITRVELAG